MRAKSVLVSTGVALLLVPALAGSAIDPAAKCQATKLKLSAKYAACRLIEESKAHKAGTAPDYTGCQTKLAEGWAKVEAALATECPTLGELGLVEETLVQCLPTVVYNVRVFIEPTDPMAHMNYFINYAESYGEFEGSNLEVSCVNVAPGAVHIWSDNDAGKQINVYFSNGSTEYTTLTEIAQCRFIATGLVPTDVADFSLGYEAASNLNNDPVDGPDFHVILEPAN